MRVVGETWWHRSNSCCERFHLLALHGCPNDHPITMVLLTCGRWCKSSLPRALRKRQLGKLLPSCSFTRNECYTQFMILSDFDLTMPYDILSCHTMIFYCLHDFRILLPAQGCHRCRLCLGSEWQGFLWKTEVWPNAKQNVLGLQDAKASSITRVVDVSFGHSTLGQPGRVCGWSCMFVSCLLVCLAGST